MSDRLYDLPLGPVTLHEQFPVGQQIDRLNQFISAVRGKFTIESGHVPIERPGEKDVKISFKRIDFMSEPCFLFSYTDPEIPSLSYHLRVKVDSISSDVVGLALPQDTQAYVYQENKADGVVQRTYIDLKSRRFIFREMKITTDKEYKIQNFIPDPENDSAEDWLLIDFSQVSREYSVPVSTAFPQAMSMRTWMDPITKETYTAYSPENRFIIYSSLDDDADRTEFIDSASVFLINGDPIDFGDSVNKKRFIDSVWKIFEAYESRSSGF